MPPRLRVLLVCNSEDDGGAGRSVYLLARDFDRARIELRVIVHRESLLTARLSEERIPWRVVPGLVETPTRPRDSHGQLASLVGNCASLLEAIDEVRADARAWNADRVYSHTTWSNVVSGVAGRDRFSVVWHIRNDHSPFWSRQLLPRLASACGVEQVIAVSRSAAEPYARLSDRLAVVHNGVDLSRIDAARGRTGLRARYGPELSGSQLLVGYVGRLVPQKGFDVFVQASRLFWQWAPHLPVRFVVLGDNPRASRDDELARARRVMPPGTLFPGYVAEPEAYIADLDVLAVPSVMRDPFPRVVIEAMALGVPIVASRTGGIPEALRDGQDGFLVPRLDPAALAERLLELASSRELRLRLGQSARAHARARHSSQATARRVQDLLLLSA
jgi:glycosyltransferase involved in cell wall biosynthesis